MKKTNRLRTALGTLAGVLFLIVAFTATSTTQAKNTATPEKQTIQTTAHNNGSPPGTVIERTQKATTTATNSVLSPHSTTAVTATPPSTGWTLNNALQTKLFISTHQRALTPVGCVHTTDGSTFVIATYQAKDGTHVATMDDCGCGMLDFKGNIDQYQAALKQDGVKLVGVIGNQAIYRFVDEDGQTAVLSIKTNEARQTVGYMAKTVTILAQPVSIAFAPQDLTAPTNVNMVAGRQFTGATSNKGAPNNPAGTQALKASAQEMTAVAAISEQAPDRRE